MHAPALIDIAGTTLNADDRRRLRHPLVGGMILFSRNWASRSQLCELTAEMHAIRPDLLICVDHEGGRVQRFRDDGFTHLPPMRALGECWMDDAAGAGFGAMAAQERATAVGHVLGAELRACGVDFSFTPVLDLDHGPSGVIGSRSLHRDPRVVATLARALILGLVQTGVAHCGKHFPGHGFASADSHVAMPVDDRSLATILADDALPYRWLAHTLQAVMPAHVIYPAVDERPAGFSARWLRDVLRRDIGFEGAIVSDDLSMAGARRIAGVSRELAFGEAALLALQAGCDLVLLCNQSLGNGEAVDAFLATLERAQRDGTWQPDAQSDARRRRLRPVGPAPSWDALMSDPTYQQARRLASGA